MGLLAPWHRFTTVISCTFAFPAITSQIVLEEKGQIGDSVYSITCDAWRAATLQVLINLQTLCPSMVRDCSSILYDGPRVLNRVCSLGQEILLTKLADRGQDGEPLLQRRKLVSADTWWTIRLNTVHNFNHCSRGTEMRKRTPCAI